MLTAIPAGFTLPTPGSVLDVGCGLQPQALWRPTREGPISVGLDAHLPYLDKLRSERAYDAILIHATWDEFMPMLVEDSFDVVVALDFIEHLERKDGIEFLEEAQRVGRSVVIFTPNGRLEQTEDAWKMGGEKWQTHRSAWKSKDFPKSKGWETQIVIENGDEAIWAVHP